MSMSFEDGDHEFNALATNGRTPVSVEDRPAPLGTPPAKGANNGLAGRRCGVPEPTRDLP
jgi:hypothetical protein